MVSSLVPPGTFVLGTAQGSQRSDRLAAVFWSSSKIERRNADRIKRAGTPSRRWLYAFDAGVRHQG